MNRRLQNAFKNVKVGGSDLSTQKLKVGGTDLSAQKVTEGCEELQSWGN